MNNLPFLNSINNESKRYYMSALKKRFQNVKKTVTTTENSDHASILQVNNDPIYVASLNKLSGKLKELKTVSASS